LDEFVWCRARARGCRWIADHVVDECPPARTARVVRTACHCNPDACLGIIGLACVLLQQSKLQPGTRALLVPGLHCRGSAARYRRARRRHEVTVWVCVCQVEDGGSKGRQIY